MGRIIGLIGWLVVTFAAAAIGSIASLRAPEFYAQLSRPSWSPPAAVFGPVWTFLYLLMAIAAWLVWRERGLAGARNALTLFIVQLVANALWSWLFFGWRLGTLAAIEVVVLVGLVAATLLAFWRIRPLAGALLLPYLAWVTFATTLTISVVRRNPDLL